MLMIKPPPHMVLQHRKVGVKEGDVRRQMENRMDGRREREEREMQKGL